MSRRPVDPVDTIWLNMDRPNNLMVIESLLLFDAPVDWDRFVAVLQRRMVDRYPVFRQRPVDSAIPLGMPHWEDDPDFDVERHLRRVRLAGPGDDAALQRYVDAHLDQPLPRDVPLWQMHLIDGYGGGAALYSRLHHALADGIALMQVLLSLTDEDAEGDLVAEPEPAAAEHEGLLASAWHLAGAAGHRMLELPRLLDPHLAVDAAVDAFNLAEKTASAASKLLFTTMPDNPLAGEPETLKRVMWSAPMSTAEVKRIGHRTGNTVNDVLMSALAGAVHTYLRDHGEEPVDIHTMVPVNLRPLDRPLPRELGNRFALVLFRLPSQVRTPFERLAETHRRMNAIKDSPEAVLTFGLIRGIGRTGKDVEKFLVDFFADKAIGVTTNVPGPTQVRYLAGTPIRTVLGWAPESGKQTMSVSIFTYDGDVTVGFKVDAGRIEHPEELVRAFEHEIAELLAFAHAG